MSKILIIEDEVAIADLEKDYLELSDFKDRKSTRLNSSHLARSRMPSSA